MNNWFSICGKFLLLNVIMTRGIESFIHSRLYHTFKHSNIAIWKHTIEEHCNFEASFWQTLLFGSIVVLWKHALEASFYEHLSRIVSYFVPLICAQCSLAPSDRPIIMLCIRPVANPCISDCSYFLLECDTCSNWIRYMCALDSSQTHAFLMQKCTHLLKYSRWTIFDIIF